MTRTFWLCMAPAFTALDQTVATAPVSYSISVTALSSSGARLFTKLWRVHISRLIFSSGSMTSDK